MSGGSDEAVELTCDVCGKNKAVGVACVPGVPASVAYCKGCLEANAHPLRILIGQTASLGGLQNCADWWVDMVNSTLGHLGKTLSWFNGEVKETMNYMEKMCNESPD